MNTLVAWQWWSIGIALIIGEAFIPSYFLMWIGLSAVLTGAITYIKPSIEGLTAFLLFFLTSGIFSCIVAPLCCRKRKKPEHSSSQQKENLKESLQKTLNTEMKKLATEVKKKAHAEEVKVSSSKKKTPSVVIEKKVKKQPENKSALNTKKNPGKSKGLKKTKKT